MLLYMSTRINSNVDEYEVSMLQLADSLFPAGMYTMSNGLEAMFYLKKIKDPEQFYNFIKTYLEQQLGPADYVALCNAYEASIKSDLDTLINIDNTLFAMKLVQEMRDASTRSGIQTLRCIKTFLDNKLFDDYYELVNNGKATGVYPVSLAVTSNALNIPKTNAGIILLYGFSASMVGAAMRLGMLHHFDGQKIIHNLRPVIANIVKNNINKSLSDIWQFAPAIDILQIKHELMDAKMFIT